MLRHFLNFGIHLFKKLPVLKNGIKVTCPSEYNKSHWIITSRSFLEISYLMIVLKNLYERIPTDLNDKQEEI